jgi:hypothetical protein
MTISPPAKAQPPCSADPHQRQNGRPLAENEPARVLAYGFDKLDLAIDVTWRRSAFFEYLATLKEQAKAEGKAMPGQCHPKGYKQPWIFTVESYGTNGYQWILRSHDITMKIGNWLEPTTRPSVLAEISSEALWQHGYRGMLDFVVHILQSEHGAVRIIKGSRADLCVDLLMRESDWDVVHREHLVTRAVNHSEHYYKRRLTGISIGRAAISARFYDKPLEIEQQSHKYWMYDVWKLGEVPEGHRIIRIEFQLRREKLKAFGSGVVWDRVSLEDEPDGVGDVFPLFCQARNVWAYCTRKWLKAVDDASKGTNRQKLLPWWKIVQAGYGRSDQANPSILASAVNASTEQLARQALGLLRSLGAVTSQDRKLEEAERVTLDDLYQTLRQKSEECGLDCNDMGERILEKLADYRRRESKHEAAIAERERLQLGTIQEQPPNSLDPASVEPVSCGQPITTGMNDD